MLIAAAYAGSVSGSRRSEGVHLEHVLEVRTARLLVDVDEVGGQGLGRTQALRRPVPGFLVLAGPRSKVTRKRRVQLVEDVRKLAIDAVVEGDGRSPESPTSAEYNYAVTTALLTARVPFAEQTSVLGRVGVEGLADDEEPARAVAERRACSISVCVITSVHHRKSRAAEAPARVPVARGSRLLRALRLLRCARSQSPNDYFLEGRRLQTRHRNSDSRFPTSAAVKVASSTSFLQPTHSSGARLVSTYRTFFS